MQSSAQNFFGVRSGLSRNFKNWLPTTASIL